MGCTYFFALAFLDKGLGRVSLFLLGYCFAPDSSLFLQLGKGLDLHAHDSHVLLGGNFFKLVLHTCEYVLQNDLRLLDILIAPAFQLLDELFALVEAEANGSSSNRFVDQFVVTGLELPLQRLQLLKLGLLLLFLD